MHQNGAACCGCVRLVSLGVALPQRGGGSPTTSVTLCSHLWHFSHSELGSLRSLLIFPRSARLDPAWPVSSRSECGACIGDKTASCSLNSGTGQDLLGAGLLGRVAWLIWS